MSDTKLATLFEIVFIGKRIILPATENITGWDVDIYLCYRGDLCLQGGSCHRNA